MNKHILYITLSLLICFSCSKNETKQENSNPVQTIAKEFDKDYGFTIFNNISKEDNNVLVSPLSTLMSFGMLYNGAIKSEIESTFSYQLWKIDNKKLIESLEKIDDGADVKIINKIIYDEDLQLNKSFIENSKADFNAQVTPKMLYDSFYIDQQEYSIDRNFLCLVNNISFIGKWKNGFVVSKQKSFFKTLDGQSKLVEMIKKDADIKYLKNDNFSMFEIPYQNERLVMTIIMPDDMNEGNDMIEKMNSKKWRNYKNQLEVKRNAHISIPKFTCQHTFSLKDALSDMELSKVFDRDSNCFSHITEEAINLSDIIQKCEIKVDEKGTDAGVSTFIAKSFTFLVNDDPVNITVNKPFFFAIEDIETNTFLFLGKIINP